MKYIWRDGNWYDADGNVMEAPDRIAVPMIQSDIPGYFSVASGKWVDGRSARRDDLARTGCRPAEPEEGPQYCTSKKWAQRLGMEWNNDPKAGKPKHRKRIENA